MRLPRRLPAHLFCSAVHSKLALACLVTISALAGAATIKQPVHTEGGAVSGVAGADPSITVFKGIPFAAPPVGDLRWRPPMPPGKWAGILKADHFAPSCMQDIVNERKPWTYEFMAHGEISEDCLYLNVWTPAKAAGDKLPVLVWIHGGGYTEGSGSVPAYDGEGLARKGIVVVTINYRLGFLGFLAYPELSRESAHGSSGNYGLLDQIAALRWVSRNIAAFGGDPTRVTVAGQSAGAGSVHFLTISPLAKGLFQRGIAESGSQAWSSPEVSRSPMAMKTLAQGEQDGTRFAEERGAHSLKDLRAMSWQQLNVNNPGRMVPVLDGWVIPEDFAATFAKGNQNDVPFLTGCNADEGGAVPHPATSLEEFRKMAQQRYSAMAGEFLRLYPAASDAQAGEAQNVSARDYARTSMYFWALEQQKTSHHKTFTYYWDHSLPGPDKETYGAFHTSEVPYVFNSLDKSDRPFDATDQAIADQMTSYWANFARIGDPNGKGLPLWPAFSASARVTMELGDRPGPIPVAHGPQFDFLEQFFAPQLAK